MSHFLLCIASYRVCCAAYYRRRLLIGSCWPIVLALGIAVASVGLEWRRRMLNEHWVSRWVSRSAIHAGLSHALPPICLLTFLLVPSTATQIFQTFRCDTYEYDSERGLSRQYLHNDLHLSCLSEEYSTTYNIALVAMVAWPIGIPLLYTTLLLASRSAISSGIETRLSRGTAFLWEDYKVSNFCWEPLEMCRKLTLTGIPAHAYRVLTSFFDFPMLPPSSQAR